MVYEKSIKLLEITQDSLYGGQFTRVHFLDNLDSTELSANSQKVIDTTYNLIGDLVAKGNRYYLKRMNWKGKTNLKKETSNNHNYFESKENKYIFKEIEGDFFEIDGTDNIDWYLKSIDNPLFEWDDVKLDNHFLELRFRDSTPALYIETLNDLNLQTGPLNRDIWWGDFITAKPYELGDLKLTSLYTSHVGDLIAFYEDSCDVYFSSLSNGNYFRTSFKYDSKPNIDTENIKNRLIGTWKTDSFNILPDSIEIDYEIDYTYQFDSTGKWLTEETYSHDSTAEHYKSESQFLISGTGNHILKYKDGGILFHFHKFIDDKLKVKIYSPNYIIELILSKETDSNMR